MSAGTKATITKGGSTCQNDATTNDAKNTGCASKKKLPPRKFLADIRGAGRMNSQLNKMNLVACEDPVGRP
jgi:hypothetical protein